MIIVAKAAASEPELESVGLGALSGVRITVNCVIFSDMSVFCPLAVFPLNCASSKMRDPLVDPLIACLALESEKNDEITIFIYFSEITMYKRLTGGGEQ